MINKIKAMTDAELDARYNEIVGTENGYTEAMLIQQEQMRRIAETASKKLCKTERLQIRITPELKEKLQALAAEDGRSVSNYIETLIKREIEKHEGS